MNVPRYRQEKKLFRLYENDINNDYIKKFCKFLNIFIDTYEDENSLMRHTFITYDPFIELNSTIIECKKYYKIVFSKLSNFVDNYKSFLNKPKYIGNIIAYMGYIYEYGLFDISYNKNTAFQYYKLAAKVHSPYGTFKLAQCYEKGIGCEKNIQKSLLFYKCSAKLGCIQGLHTFGTILLQNNLKGEFVEESACFYLQLAIKKAKLEEYPYVFYDYGRYLEYKLNDKFISQVEYCFQIYLKGSEIECPNCQFRVAQCFELGNLNISVDIAQSLKMYIKAAFNGHVEAQLKVAQIIIENENSTIFDFSKAFKYAFKAAVKENCIAIKLVSIFYEKGLGTPKNLNASLWWNKIFEIVKKKKNLTLNSPIFEKLENVIIQDDIPLQPVFVNNITTANALKVK